MKALLKSTKSKVAFAFGLALFAYGLGSTFMLFLTTTNTNRQLPGVTPKTVGLNYEDVSFYSKADDHIKMSGWWIPRPDSYKVLILLHVKNGDRTFPLSLTKPLWDNGYNLLLFDLRGHGLSEGGNYTYGFKEQYDVLGAVNFLKDKGFQGPRIGVIGWSMGAASAIMAMSQTPDIQAGISDSAYGDLSRVVKGRLGWLGFFYPGLTLSAQLFDGIDIDRVKPEGSLKKLGNRHLILIHGDQDTTVPVSEVYHLQEAGGTNITETWVLPGVGHGMAFVTQPSEYLQKALTFFNRELS